MEVEDELLWEEGVAEPALEESLLQEAPVPELPALHCCVLQEEGEGLGLCRLWPKEGVEGEASAHNRGCFIHFGMSSLHLDCTELPVMVSSLSL